MNPVGVVYKIYLLINSIAASLFIKDATTDGMVRNIDANITGITPDELIFIGKHL